MSIKGLVKKAVSTYARSSRSSGAHAGPAANRPVKKRSPEARIVNGVMKYAKKKKF
ncbi:hypothetical protein [Roseivivax sediminis]|uniref:Uncharacterized protein n=1 Tax=Roseivivax sediminis TaxID=936889 RepID=A0A1I2AWU1_9RHOB|nr:hypothetical protein [Roseivivax sediminis]SFE47360.1 hypothetical protein SAMN04515678_11061 [Roseivivax sediminis]